MILGLVLVAAIGAFQALHGSSLGGWTDVVLAGLMGIEHASNGSTTS